MDILLRLIFLLPMIALMFFVDLRDQPVRLFQGSDIPITNSTGKWESVGQLPSQRYDFGGAILNNSLYLVGGLVLPTPWLPTDRVDAYDFTTKTWKRIRNYPRVVHHAGVTTCDGRLYVIGGYWLRIAPSAHVYMYEEASNSWVKRADLPEARGALGATCIDGQIYVAGGESNGKWSNRLDVYDTKTDAWESKKSMTAAREHLAVVAAENKIFAMGGLVKDRFHTLTDNEMYDPKTDTWVKRAPLPHSIAGFSTAVLGDSIYLFGGLRGDSVSAEVFEYKTKEDVWIRRRDLPSRRYGMIAATVDKTIHVLGGNEIVKGIFLNQDHLVLHLN